MDLQDTLTALRHLAESDPAVRDRLLASAKRLVLQRCSAAPPAISVIR